MTDVAATATTSTPSLPGRWRFLPTTLLMVDNTDIADCDVGEIYYESPMHVIACALRIKDWVFCMERLSPLALQMGLRDDTSTVFTDPSSSPPSPTHLDTTGWRFAAFHGDSHHTWQIVFPDGPEMLPRFIGHTLARFYPMVCGRPVGQKDARAIKLKGGPPDNETAHATQLKALTEGKGLGGGAGSAAAGTWTTWPALKQMQMPGPSV